MDPSDQKIAALEADRVALMIVLGTLIQSHHDWNALQLRLMANLEQQMNGGALGNTLDPGQRERVREIIEWLGAIRSASSTPAQKRAGPPRRNPSAR